MDEDFRRTFYYPEDLETFDAETKTGIIESQEGIDDFITHNMRILFHKAHLYKSIRFIFTCGKGLYSQSEWRTAISHVEV